MRDPIDALRSLHKYVALALEPDVVAGRRWEVRLAYDEGAFRRPFARVGFAGRALAAGPAHTTDYTQPCNVLVHHIETETPTESVLEAGRVSALLTHAFRFGAGPVLDAPIVSVASAPGVLPAGMHSWTIAPVNRQGEGAASEDVVLALNVAGGAALSWPHVDGATGYRIYRDGLVTAATPHNEFHDAGGTPVGAAHRARGTIGQPMRVPLWDWTGVRVDEDTTKRGYADYLRVVDLSVGTVDDPRDDTRIAVSVDVRLRWSQARPMPSATTLAALGIRFD